MVDLHTPSMFDETGQPSAAVVTTLNPRQDITDAAFRKAKAEWVIRYTAYVLEFAETATEPFSAEDVREAYLATPGVPKTDHEQASGSIFQQLVKKKNLIPIGTKRSRKYGNWLQTYAANKQENQ